MWPQTLRALRRRRLSPGRRRAAGALKRVGAMPLAVADPAFPHKKEEGYDLKIVMPSDGITILKSKNVIPSYECIYYYS